MVLLDRGERIAESDFGQKPSRSKIRSPKSPFGILLTRPFFNAQD
jgi:hypothetical protein